MAADPTPEERAASNFNRVFEGRGPIYVARLADLIREVEAAARAKAFEEAAAILDQKAAHARTQSRQALHLGHFEQRSRFEGEVRACMDLAEKIRARAKEAPPHG